MLGRYLITWSQNHQFWFWVVRIEWEQGLTLELDFIL
jgi:hypothetical protein